MTTLLNFNGLDLFTTVLITILFVLAFAFFIFLRKLPIFIVSSTLVTGLLSYALYDGTRIEQPIAYFIPFAIATAGILALIVILVATVIAKNRKKYSNEFPAIVNDFPVFKK